jgi:peptidoglycan hydrolase-like protein with peptidoglycan-binding domain
MAILKKGVSGEPVRRLQAKLGVEADGEFGPNTERALKDWQTKKGLPADGIAGPDTFMAMGLYELVLLKQGTRGDAVKKLQEKLAIGADGQYGSGTEKAVRDYQQKNGLVAAGPVTLASLPAIRGRIGTAVERIALRTPRSLPRLSRYSTCGRFSSIAIGSKDFLGFVDCNMLGSTRAAWMRSQVRAKNITRPKGSDCARFYLCSEAGAAAMEASDRLARRALG